MFGTYLKLGIDHILDVQGYDHILFIVALCAVYLIGEWKKVLVLATAFTIGHSLTLGLSALDMIHFSSKLIEILIPVTIILTAITNMVRNNKIFMYYYSVVIGIFSPLFKIFAVLFKINPNSDKSIIPYFLPLVFGLIHGMGFSTFFRALMGSSSEVIMPLFAFNVGVELGQIVIIVITMLLSYILVEKLGLKRKLWNYGISAIAIVVSLYLIYEKVA